MEDWYFHVLDIAHGIVMAALVFFIFRLLNSKVPATLQGLLLFEAPRGE
ncbi:MAG: hypothetical protein IJS49_06805 [Paludibacteraceae bacterium]|nr:hypothetical protein [Paludibacteraceae bacterium]